SVRASAGSERPRACRRGPRPRRGCRSLFSWQSFDLSLRSGSQLLIRVPQANLRGGRVGEAKLTFRPKEQVRTAPFADNADCDAEHAVDETQHWLLPGGL